MWKLTRKTFIALQSIKTQQTKHYNRVEAKISFLEYEWNGREKKNKDCTRAACTRARWTKCGGSVHPDTVLYLEVEDVPEICTRRKRMKLAGYRVARLLFYAGNGFLASCDVRRCCIPYTQCTHKISYIVYRLWTHGIVPRPNCCLFQCEQHRRYGNYEARLRRYFFKGWVVIYIDLPRMNTTIRIAKFFSSSWNVGENRICLYANLSLVCFKNILTPGMYMNVYNARDGSIVEARDYDCFNTYIHYIFKWVSVNQISAIFIRIRRRDPNVRNDWIIQKLDSAKVKSTRSHKLR